MREQYMPTELAGGMDQAEFICSISWEDLQEHIALLDFLSKHPTPYYHYVLYHYSDALYSFPIGTGMAETDLCRQLTSLGATVEFDEVYLFHSSGKSTAEQNQKRLAALLGTRHLFDGAKFEDLGYVDRSKIQAAVAGLHEENDLAYYTDSPTYEPCTYNLTPVLREALHLWTEGEALERSEAVPVALAQGIPFGYLEEARKALT